MVFRHIDVFSGLGGFTVMLKGVSLPIAYCDIDKHAQMVLTNNMRKGKLPVAPIVDDVKDLSAFIKKNVKDRVDIVTASSPCLGHSLAGKREGFGHKDSALFEYVYDVVDAAKPPVVLLENTPYISNEMTRILSGFVKRRYDVAWTVLPAYVVGSPQSRSRWFCVCYNDPKTFVKLMGGLQKNVKPFSWHRERIPRNVVEQGVGHHARLKLLGNAIVPQCAQAAFVHILHRILDKTERVPVDFVPKTGLATRDGRMFEMPSVSIIKPDRRLVLKGNGLTLTKSLWPTPRAQKTGSCATLSPRCSRDLATALRFEVNSPKGHSNPRWVEWLMGYPPDWTRL